MPTSTTEPEEDEAGAADDTLDKIDLLLDQLTEKRSVLERNGS